MAVIKAVIVISPVIVFFIKFINGLDSFEESLPQILLIRGYTMLNKV